LREQRSYLGVNPFHEVRPLTRKENSCRDPVSGVRHVIRACGPWWLKPLCETHDQGTISCPPTRAPKETPAPHLKSATFLVETMQFETELYQNESSFHHSQPFSSCSPPPYLATRSKPRASTLTDRQIVPSIQFQVLLTLFSQFFSTFLRSTSPLSVSMSYLGLEEIYLPFYALFPKYATRKQKEIRETQSPATGLSPSLAPISIGLCKPCARNKTSLHPGGWSVGTEFATVESSRSDPRTEARAS
jgi:hypothetical protein